ncbi:MAG TPA: 8-amino-7-oxononanoate synthase [Verrucomicrobiae bacterium]|nr:8-amino-7-oxononanoate synthase [Verrucomicrobiae bacterium]
MRKNFGARLDELRRQGLYRTMRTVEGEQGSSVELDGRRVLLFCSNNYLGLATHPSVLSGAAAAVREYGASSGASRLVSGTMSLHRRLEERLACFKGTERALVFNSGHAANVGIIPALVGRGDEVFSDRLNHASIVDGCLLSRARFHRYPHRDTAALRRLLQEETQGTRLVVTDGVFSMDGDLAPLQEIASLAEEHGALLMVDDAHGSGVLGEHGRGSAELLGVEGRVDVHMGTLGKGLGSFGAYAAGSAELVEWLVNSSRSFIFSPSLPPAALGASIAALDVVESEEGRELGERLRANAALMKEGLRSCGFDTMGSSTHIIPVLVGDPERTMEFTALLLEEGVFVQGIRPPTVPRAASRLRCTVMATHTREEILRTVDAFRRVGRGMGVI